MPDTCLKDDYARARLPKRSACLYFRFASHELMLTEVFADLANERRRSRQNQDSRCLNNLDRLREHCPSCWSEAGLLCLKELGRRHRLPSLCASGEGSVVNDDNEVIIWSALV